MSLQNKLGYKNNNEMIESTVLRNLLDILIMIYLLECRGKVESTNSEFVWRMNRFRRRNPN